jgi:hypothetical protein
MQPDKDGRFCGSCQKTVVDFTTMSDQEILNWLSGADSSVCGRFMGDQLNRNLAPANPHRKSRWAVWQFLLAGLLISSEVSAQEQPAKPPVSQTDKKPDLKDGIVSGLVMRLPSVEPHITVQVVDIEDGQPVPGATVRIDNHAFSSDEKGQVSIARAMALKAHTLEITSVGYERKTMTLDKSIWKDDMLTISLPLSRQIMGEVVVTTSTTVKGKMSLRCDTSYTFGRFLKDTLSLVGLGKKPLTVYPNPVARGASATISLRDIRPGNYMAQLYSGAGALVESIHLENVDGPRTELLNIPATIAAGPYFVKLVEISTGKSIVSELVIF